MKFEVLNRSNQRIFWTKHESCVPDTETQQQLLDTGYRIMYNQEIQSSPIVVCIPETNLE